MTNRGLRIAVVGVPGGWSSEQLADCIADRTGFRLIVDFESVVTDLERGRVTYGDWDLGELDGIVIKKIGKAYSPHMLDRLDVLQYLADRGVRVYSSPASIKRLLNRLTCTLTLARAGIPMPPTCVTENIEEAVRAVRRFETAVFKPLFSTKARGMQLLHGDDPELQDKLRSITEAGHPLLYLQKKVELPDRDLCFVFVGGRHIGAYARVKQAGSEAWNTTTRSGGHYEPQASTPDLVELAWRSQALFEMELTSVDVVETRTGPVVFEVSAFGGFRGLHESSSIDAAGIVADHLISKVQHG